DKTYSQIHSFKIEETIEWNIKRRMKEPQFGKLTSHILKYGSKEIKKNLSEMPALQWNDDWKAGFVNLYNQRNDRTKIEKISFIFDISTPFLTIDLCEKDHGGNFIMRENK